MKTVTDFEVYVVVSIIAILTLLYYAPTVIGIIVDLLEGISDE